MRTKLISALLSLCMCFSLLACGANDNAIESQKGSPNGHFTTVEEWKDNGDYFEIVYTKDTKVMYLIWIGYYKGSITPLYNADGTLQIYEEE